MKRLLRLVSPSFRSFAMLAFAILAAASPPASAEGTRTLHPNGATGERGVMDASDGTFFANVARGRQFLYVYAQAGEHILLGSRNRSNGGGIFVYNPQSFGTPGDETIPGAASFTCSSGGTIASRAQELAGPNSADGTATVTDGFTPCSYVAPTTGIYGVRFTGATSGGQTNSASIATPPILTGDLVSAWDVTVRNGANSLADLNGRLFTYAWTVYLNSNSRRLYNDLYYVSTDGYRYKQTFQGLDPNRAAFYANAAGFLDTNGAPLYRDLRGGNAAVTTGPSITAGITAQRPQYPIFFSDIAPAGVNATEVARVLTALAIPLVPAPPQLSSPLFVGNVGGNTSTESAGGLFTFTTLNTLTYEIVISRDGVDFDPANVLNRVLTGTALSGNHSVLWDGRDNSGNPFPVGTYDFQIVGRNGEIHFPMIDVEANFEGGPTLTKLNGTALDTTTVYYDDRGYRAANNTAIGTLNGHLCGAGSAVTQPVPTHSLIGVDSSDANLGGSGNYYRSWNGSADSNTDCQNAASQFFGTAKGLDLWALEKSPVQEEPIVIVAPTVGVDVGTQVAVTPTVLSGDTAFGSFVFSNAGDAAANGVTYGVTLGNPALPATCPAAVNFTLLPPGVVATYNPAPACTITFTGMPTTLTPGQSLSFNFSYVVAPTNPGPIPITTNIAATNENNNVAPNTANAQTVVAKPIITVAKSADPASGESVDIGDLIEYTVNVTIANAPLTATFTLVDTLSPGLTFGTVISSNPAFNCSGSLTCTLPSGTATGTYTVTYSATVANTAAGNVSNSVEPTGGGGENPPACTPTCDTTHPLNAPNLTIGKTGPATAVVGVAYNYSLTVTNNGTADATANATVTDSVPAGLTINSAGPGCTFVGQAVICTIAQADLQMTESVVITINVTPTVAAGASVSNTASITGGGDPDCVAAGDCDSPPVDTTLNAPNLVIAKTGPATAVVGVAYDYTLTVTNNGTADATANATVTDSVPAGLTINSAGPGCTFVGQAVTCTIAQADLQMTESVVITINVTPTAAAGTSVSNTASITGGGDPECVAAGDCDSPPVNTTLNAPNLVIAKTGPATAVVGVAYDYTLTVTNNGTADATANATVTDSVPAGLTINSAGPGCTFVGQAVTCTIAQADLQTSESVVITINVTPTVAAGASVSNTASITGGGDPDCVVAGDCDSPPVDTTLNAPNLVIAKTGPATAVVGVAYDYTLTVTNNGTADATANATVTDLVPTGLTINSAGPGCTFVGQTVTCTIAQADLQMTESVVITINVTPTAAAGASVSNTASITGGGDPDCVAAGDCDSPPVDTTLNAPNLVIAKTGPATAVVGVAYDYTLTVTNNGTADATANATVTDTVPTGLTINSAGPGCTFVGQAVTCTIAQADLQTTESVVITINVTPTAAAGASVSNTASIIGGGDPDCEAAGDCDSPPVVTTITEPDVSVSKTANPPDGTSVAPGDTITYTLSVALTGAASTADLVLTDTLDPQLENFQVVNNVDGFVLGGAGNTRTFTLVEGTAIGTYTVSYSVDVVASATGSVGNNVAIDPTGNGGDPDPGCTTCSTTHPLVSDVTLTKALSAEGNLPADGIASPGETLTYSITLANSGGVDETGYAVTDILDANVVFVSADTGGIHAAGTVTWTGLTVPAGDSLVLTVTVQVVDPLPADAVQVVNLAFQTGELPPPCPSAGCVETPVPVVPDLSLVKQATLNDGNGNTLADAGDTIDYTLTATNTGNIALAEVEIDDPRLPALTCVPVQPATLDIGETLVCTGSYTVTQADVDAGTAIDNTATATAPDPTDPDPTNPTLPPLEDDDSTTTPIAPSVPGIDLLKEITSGATYANAGDSIAYRLTATNTGNVTLVNVGIVDPLLGTLACTPTQPATLAPGATLVCTGSYTVTPGDIDNGSVTNTATVTATPPSGGPIQDSDEEVATGPLAGPSIVVLKTRTDTTAPVVAGTQLSYQIVATNNGNVTLSGVTVSDSLIAGLTCVPTLPATLAAGASVTCTGSYTTTQGDVDAGSVTNTATASGTPPGPVGTPPVTDTDDEITTIPPTPALEVVKVATLNDSNGNGMGDEGESIGYAVSVRNTGNVTLIGLVVTDSLGGAAPVTLTCAPTTLAPDQSATCNEYSHTITLAEALAGAALVNVATATANDPDGDPVTGSDTTSTPLGDVVADLAIQKTGPASGEIGAEVTFTIVVRNLGPNTAVNTVLTDPTPAGLQFVANMGACTTAFPCDLGNLALGESRTVQTRFLIPAGYSGPSTIVNIASVTSDTPDPTPGDTSSSASTIVGSGFTPGEPAVIPANRHQALVLLVLLMFVMASGALRRRG